jgi:hypothetical protein
MKKIIQDYVFDVLEEEMINSGLKYNYIAKYLGMHVVTLNNKRIGYIRFKEDEKEKLKELLRYKGTIEELFVSNYDTSKPKKKNKRLD